MVVGYELVETWLARVKSTVPIDDMLAGMGTWCEEPEEGRPEGADLFFEGACRIDPASSCSGSSLKSVYFCQVSIMYQTLKTKTKTKIQHTVRAPVTRSADMLFSDSAAIISLPALASAKTSLDPGFSGFSVA